MGGSIPCSSIKFTSVSLPRRTEQWNRFALVAAVNSKVFLVGGDHYVSRIEFAHADQTKICQVRTTVGVTLGKFAQMLQLLGNLERDLQQSIRQHLQGRFTGTNVKGCLR